MDCSVFLLFLLTTSAGFKVSVPAGRVVAVRGQPAILGCEFTPDSDLSPLVVTWQRVEDSRVVHSFYYRQDQLSKQSPQYRNRTALFVSELQKGNATLRIESAGPTDAGEYLCSVSNTKGTDKAQVRLEYGAFYTEPRLSVNVTCSSVTLTFEAEGFPKPEVRWFGERGELLSDHSEFSEDPDGPHGAVALYRLRSRHVSSGSSLKAVFMLKNRLLNQDLLRPVSITYGGEDGACGASTIGIVVLGVLCLLLLLCLVALLVNMQRMVRCRRSHTLINGSASRKAKDEISMH